MKTITFRYSILFTFFFLLGLNEQTNAQNYIHMINAPGPGEESFIQQSVASFGQNAYIVAGTYVHPATKESDILVSMLDNGGNILWSQYIDYGADEFVGAVIVDFAQNIVLTGYTGTNDSSNPPKNLIVVRLNSNGGLMDDLIINDRGGYSLYGFDIEWTADGDYIIAGTGVSAPSATSSKFGFVLSVASNLSAGIIHWGRKYMTGGIFSERQYDSFNDILPIKGRSQFLLTGSGATPNGEQMITNDLIDQAGNSVWSNPIGHYEGVTSYNNFGIRALYDGNQFYILYPGVENIPSIMILDGSGIFVSAVNIHNHAYPITNEVNVLLNGMEWNGESTIVLSGYYIDFQAPYTGWPLQIHWAGGPSSAWIKYQAPFDGNALKNVSVDFMVRPINYSNPSFPHMINQIYYQPKALITTTSGLAFAAPYQSASAPNIFDLSFLKPDRLEI